MDSCFCERRMDRWELEWLLWNVDLGIFERSFRDDLIWFDSSRNRVNRISWKYLTAARLTQATEKLLSTSLKRHFKLRLDNLHNASTNHFNSSHVLHVSPRFLFSSLLTFSRCFLAVFSPVFSLFSREDVWRVACGCEDYFACKCSCIRVARVVKRVTRWNLIAQLTAAQPTNKKGYTGSGGWEMRNENESFSLCPACLYWTTRPFFVQIPNRIKWQSNSFLDIQYLPFVLRIENWKCLLHERREIFLGLLLNSHPHGFYRIQTTRNKKMSSKKCQISILKRTLKSWFRVLIFRTHRSVLSGATFFVRISCDVWMKRWEANSHVARCVAENPDWPKSTEKIRWQGDNGINNVWHFL